MTRYRCGGRFSGGILKPFFSSFILSTKCEAKSYAEMETGGLSYYKSNEVNSNKEKLPEPLFKVVYSIFLPSKPTAVCMSLNHWRVIYNPGV